MAFQNDFLIACAFFLKPLNDEPIANDNLQDIDEFLPAVDGNWTELDSLLAELRQSDISRNCLGVLLGVFERFPDDDGAGAFWSIVHGTESADLDYEKALRESLERRRSAMGEVMLRRLEKSREV